MLVFVSNCALALPFTLTPTATLPSTIVQDETTNVTYTVTNNTSSTRTGNYVKYLPTNVTNAGTGTCGSGTFDLASGASCTLTLTISGAVNRDDTDPHKHLYVCFQGGLTCAGPTYANQLNVAVITVSSVAVTPTEASVVAGRTQQFTATATYSDGTTADVTSSSDTTWASSDTDVATIGASTGLATAAAESGTSNITATHHSVASNEAVFTATAKVLESIAIIPTTANLIPPGDTTDSQNRTNYTATGSYSFGADEDITSSVTWASSDTDVATISNSNPNEGLATAVGATSSPSSTTITATLDSITSNSATLNVYKLTGITIAPAAATIFRTGNNTQQYSACGAYLNYTGGGGSSPCSTNEQVITSESDWDSTDTTNVATISSSGLATAKSSGGGKTNIKATLSDGTADVESNTAILGVIPNSVAVGFYNDGSNNQPASYTSDNGGSSWAQSTTLPASEGAVEHNLASVACGQTGQTCVTVGQYTNGVETPLIYKTSNGGSSWSAEGVTPEGTGDNVLNSATCNRTSSSNTMICVAVGYYRDTINLINELLSYHTSDGGNNWIKSLGPANSVTENVTSVACDVTQTAVNSMDCVAVGYESSPQDPIAYTSTNPDGSGQTWVKVSITGSAGASDNYTLTGVACDETATNCTAVGYNDSATTNIADAYVTSDGGSTWSAATTQPASPSNSDDIRLQSVSCISSTSICVAAGYYTNTAQSNRKDPVFYRSTDLGVNWSSAITPRSLAGTVDVYMNSVKCFEGTTHCEAVGYRDTSGTEAPTISYSSDDSGSTWTENTTSPPVINSSTDNRVNGAG